MGRLISLPHIERGIGWGETKPAVNAHAGGRTSGPERPRRPSWPHISGLTLAMLAGTWAVVTGLPELVATTTGLLEAPIPGRRRARTALWLFAVVGLAAMATGLVALMRPDAGAAAPATVLGTYALVVGAVLLVVAWQPRDVVSWSR